MHRLAAPRNGRPRGRPARPGGRREWTGRGCPGREAMVPLAASAASAPPITRGDARALRKQSLRHKVTPPGWGRRPSPDERSAPQDHVTRKAAAVSRRDNAARATIPHHSIAHPRGVGAPGAAGRLPSTQHRLQYEPAPGRAERGGGRTPDPPRGTAAPRGERRTRPGPADPPPHEANAEPAPAPRNRRPTRRTLPPRAQRPLVKSHFPSTFRRVIRWMSVSRRATRPLGVVTR
jgi:hypothetical protein